MDASQARKVLVTGDITVDWLQASPGVRKTGQNWDQLQEARLYCQWGGAALLCNLVNTLLPAVSAPPAWELLHSSPRLDSVQPDDPHFHHSYSLWAPFPYGQKPPADREKPAWRIENFLGLQRSTAGSGPLPPETNPGGYNLILLDDANLGFRDHPEYWQDFLAAHSGLIVLKMAHPVAQGALWERLIDQHDGRLVVVTTAYDLRRTAIQISRKISWERTAQDVVWELTYNPIVNSLSRAAHLVVSFGCAGAVLLHRDKSAQLQAQLFFDPSSLEDEWQRSQPGRMLGYTACLAASLANQVLLNFDNPDFAQGIQSGVSAARLLHRDGYGQRGTGPARADLHFPLENIAREITRGSQPLAQTPIQDPAGSLLTPPPPAKTRLQRGYWTILEDRHTDQLEFVARQIVLEGSGTALRDVPVGRFGALLTVDRREIEALNGIQRLIGEYCLSPQKKPLSLAVFGPPGAGKSFGVEQVAKSILDEIAVLSFNISQFGHPEDLLDALHQVRDKGLSGKIPLVFWDEFDTALDGQPLGWLRYFLAPMQDGAFQQGQIVHPIGRCVFVFAGGTSHRMDLFGAELEETQQRAVKLPDFISRLKGFLNVLGPNPIQDSGNADPYFILRRALILRSLFERNVPQIFASQEGKKIVQIDSGLLRAFLQTGYYKHGVRSMESLISMSTLTGKNAFERSSLPPEEQLNLHVSAAEFLALMQQLELEGELLERLAAAAHEVFCEGLLAEGTAPGSLANAGRKNQSALRPFADLPADEKEQNRQNVRHIAQKLAQTGYVMSPARSNEPSFEFPGKDLEFLSEQEHERWMRDKLSAGWQYAPQTDKSRRMHNALLPWDRLPEEEKEKDRRMVRGIPVILARAGYAVEKAG